MDRELLAAAPKHKILTNIAIGYSKLSAAALDEPGGWGINCPGVLAESATDHTRALVLAVARRAATYRRFFKSGHTQLCDYVHTHSAMKTFLHPRGSIYSPLPDVIECGFDVIHPVRIACFQMEPECVKAQFFKDIAFRVGRAVTRKTLNHETPHAVNAGIRRRMDLPAPSGGFVFNPSNNILAAVAPENIAAIPKALEEFGGDAS